MGSFDMACAVSGVTLGGCQPTKILFIVKQSSRSSGIMCYPSDAWKLCSLPIDATYDDYGRYTFDETQPEWVTFVEFVKKHGKPIEQGDNEYHDIAFDPKNPDHFTIEYLFDLMHEGRLTVYNGAEIQPFPVHAEIYKILMKPWKSWTGKRVTIKNVCSETKQRFKASCKLNSDSILSIYAEKLKKGEVDQEAYDKIVTIFKDRPLFMEVGTSEFFGATYVLSEYLKMTNKEKFWEKVSELHMFWAAALRFRFMFHPMMSAGQDYDFKDAAFFHSKCAQVAKQLQKEVERDE